MNTSSNNNIIRAITENIEKVVVGKRASIELLTLALMCDGHVLIEDVPGTGKTTLALALSKSIGGTLKRVSCTPDIMPSDITGFSMYNPKTQTFDYHEGAIMANVFLADEINRTPPKTQAGLLEAMEEKQVTVDGKKYGLPTPFIVIATQNPVEYLGTYPLPEAQLDRFLVKVSIGYPDKKEEVKIINRFEKSNPLHELKAVTSLEEIGQLQEYIHSIMINDEMKHYIVDLVAETRETDQLRMGISPRGTLCLATMARALAYYNGRDYVIPDDIKQSFIPVCAHRVVLSAEAEYDRIEAKEVLLGILNKVPIVG